MGYLLFPTLLLIVFGPAHEKPVLADFGRFATAIGQEVSIIDVEGWAHEGVIRAATSSAVTVQFGPTYRTFQNGTITSAERLRDRNVDGAIKGALVGFLMGGLASQGARNTGEAWRIALMSTAIYSGVGYVIDAGDRNREPLYKAALPPPPLKVSLRFD